MVEYVKISALPAASSADGGDQLETNQGGTSRRVTVSQLLAVGGGTAAPTGPAGGDLAGTYPDPTVKSAAGAFAVTGALTGTMATFSGTVINSSPSSFSLYYADSPAGFNRGLQMRTGTSARWIFYTDNVAESGGNAGSNFGIVRYSDAGANIGTPLSIVRSTGVVSIPNATTTTQATADNTTNVATTAYVKAQGYATTATLGNYLPLTGGALATPGNLTIAGTLGVTGTLTGTGISLSSFLTLTSGNITASGGNIIVNRAGDSAPAIAYLQADNGYTAGLHLSGQGNADRWRIYKDVTAEAASNVGADLVVESRDNAGNALATPLKITRSNGTVTLTGTLSGTLATMSTAIAVGSNDSTVATTKFVKDQGYATTATLGNYLPLTGGTLAGPGDLAVGGTLGVTGALTGTLATMSTSVTTPLVTAPAASVLSLNAPTGQQIQLKINNAAIVATNGTAWFPQTTNAIGLGGGSNRWSNVYSVLGDFTGALTGTTAAFSGAITTPTPTASSNDTTVATTAFVTSAVATLPQNNPFTNYTLVASDAGKHIYYNTALTATITIPANASVPFPIGTTITIINDSGVNISLTSTSDAMILSPAGTGTLTRTVATAGVATIIKTAATRWMLTGTGIT